MSTEERESLYITLKAIFKEVAKESSLVGKISLISLANQLSLVVKSEDYTLREVAYSFYWFSHLVYWKAEWLFASSKKGKIKAISSKKKIFDQKKNRPKSLGKEVQSLVLYLEHKTFKSLALDRKESKTKIIPLRQENLKEIYSNLKKEKAKKGSLSHIEIQESIFSSFLAKWEPLLNEGENEFSFNKKISSFNFQEKTLAFMDVLQRNKKGDLELTQKEVREEIFLKKLKREPLKSYG